MSVIDNSSKIFSFEEMKSRTESLSFAVNYLYNIPRMPLHNEEANTLEAYVSILETLHFLVGAEITAVTKIIKDGAIEN